MGSDVAGDAAVSPLLQRLRAARETVLVSEDRRDEGLRPDAPAESTSARTGVSPLLQQLRCAAQLQTADEEQVQALTCVEDETPAPAQPAIPPTTMDSMFGNVSALLQRLRVTAPQSLSAQNETVESSWSEEHRRRVLSLPPPSEEEEEYDPRKPEYIQPATAEEITAVDEAILCGQITHLRIALQARQDEGGGVLHHYWEVLQDLEAKDKTSSMPPVQQPPEPRRGSAFAHTVAKGSHTSWQKRCLDLDVQGCITGKDEIFTAGSIARKVEILMESTNLLMPIPGLPGPWWLGLVLFCSAADIPKQKAQ